MAKHLYCTLYCAENNHVSLLPNIPLQAGYSSVQAASVKFWNVSVFDSVDKDCVGCDFSHSVWGLLLFSVVFFDLKVARWYLDSNWAGKCWIKLDTEMVDFPSSFAHDVISSVVERKTGFKSWDLNTRHLLVAVSWAWPLTSLSLGFCELMGIISACSLNTSGQSLNGIKEYKGEVQLQSAWHLLIAMDMPITKHLVFSSWLPLPSYFPLSLCPSRVSKSSLFFVLHGSVQLFA